MDHSLAISSADAFKFCECDANVLLAGISLIAGVVMIHNRRFVFDTKSTRAELIEFNIYSSAFVS